jgi:hypothetical protein
LHPRHDQVLLDRQIYPSLIHLSFHHRHSCYPSKWCRVGRRTGIQEVFLRHSLLPQGYNPHHLLMVSYFQEPHIVVRIFCSSL